MQKKNLIRTGIAAAAVAVAGTTAVVGATVAGAAPGDPVQNSTGYTTLSIPQDSVLRATAKEGVSVLPLSPASFGTATDTGNVDFNVRVDGGSASAPALYGDVHNTGSIVINDARTKKSVTLSGLDFSFDTQQITVTEPDGVTTVTLLDVVGGGQVGGQPRGEQFYENDKTVLDPAGAAYLDQVLHTKVFKAGAAVSSFYTDFVNTQY